MSPAGTPEVAATRPARRRARFGVWLLISLPLVALAVVFALMVLTHRPLPAPVWLISRIEARANAALAGSVQVRLTGGADLVVDEGFVPRVRFHAVEILRPSGLPLAVLPELRTTLYAQPLLRGKIVPRSFRVTGASLSLRRTPDGALDLALGRGNLALPRPENAAEAIAAFEAVFATPALARLERIDAEALELRLDDARLNRVWRVSAGRLVLTQDRERISVTLGFDVGEVATAPASVALSVSSLKGSAETSFGAAVTAVAARDLAVQSPALAWLAVLDAPISGSLRSGIDAAGQVGRLDAMLEIGAGALSPAAGARPLPFEGGKVYLAYDPRAAKVTFSDLSFDSRAIRLRANGQAVLKGLRAGLPDSLLGQVAITDLQLDPEGLFATPAQFSQGAVDLRLRLDPFQIDLGQVQLIEGERRISARGRVGADDAGWRVALDLGVDRISQEGLLALWPPALVPRTRDWVAANVATGELHNVAAAVRVAPGSEPRLALGYEFRGAEVRVIKSLPSVADGSGFATILGTRHAMMVEAGHVTAPEGGRIDVADTVMVVPDIRIKPAPAEVILRTKSAIPAALSLLDQPPFEFMTKAGQPTDIAQGRAEAETVLKLVLARKVDPKSVDYDVNARLYDVRSDTIVPGRTLEAAALSLSATREGLQISGPGTLSGTAFDARWSQRFGPEHRGVSRLEGSVEISPAALDAFAITLPKGAVAGRGTGQITLDLTRGAPTRYALSSDLRGLTLKIPQIGWTKAVGTAGRLRLSGTLGQPPVVEALELDAAGLTARGRVTLKPEGGLDLAAFSEVGIGSWFRGSVDLRGQGPGRAPAVFVSGGRADLRGAGLAGGGGAGSGAGGPLSVALDRLTVSEGIALTGFRGDFDQKGGLNGSFAARVNGEAPIIGDVVPGPGGGSAFRIRSDDAGATMAAARVFGRARGGTLDLTLTPGGNPGSYDGRAVMKGLKVRDAPVLAAMLGAASGIGLLEQLNGDGLVFNDVEGVFRLTPEGVSITRGDAVGASLGVTMTGNYYPGSDKIDMQGVVSPFYLINGIGQVLTRRGEGVFGFTYRLRGTSAAPQISINPLSLLTPGMFRELFRRAPPKVLQ